MYIFINSNCDSVCFIVNDNENVWFLCTFTNFVMKFKWQSWAQASTRWKSEIQWMSEWICRWSINSINSATSSEYIRTYSTLDELKLPFVWLLFKINEMAAFHYSLFVMSGILGFVVEWGNGGGGEDEKQNK